MEPVFGADAEQVLVGTVNPNYSRMVLLSFACLGFGFIAAQIGSYNQRRFNRPPRPDERLAKELKGFDDRYSLFAWMLPAAYVFLGPTGVYTFALREQAGLVTNERDKWKHKGSKLGFLLAFSNEGIGNPYPGRSKRRGQDGEVHRPAPAGRWRSMCSRWRCSSTPR